MSFKPIGVDHVADLLHKLQLFKSTDREDVMQLAKLGKFHTFTNGGTIIRQGAKDQTAFLVLEGQLSIYRDDLLMARFEHGQLFGDFSMMDGSSYTASAIAETDCHLFSINRESFLTVVAGSETFAMGVISSLCKKLKRHL